MKDEWFYRAFIGGLIVGAWFCTAVATDLFTAGLAVFFALFALWVIVWERPR